MKVFTVQLNPVIGDIEYNTKKILSFLQKAKEQKADVVLFPELCLCGYPPEDLLLFDVFIEKVEKNLKKIAKETKDLFVAIGCVRKNEEEFGKRCFNSAAICIDGKIIGYKDKTLLPTYDVFDEARYFEEGKEQKIFEYKDKKIGIVICEDVWQHAKIAKEVRYKRDPILELEKLSPDLVLNMTASPYYFQKIQLRLDIYQAAVKTLQCPMFVSNQVGSNDELVFDGYSMYINEKEKLIYLAKGFEEDAFLIDLNKEENKGISLPSDDLVDLYQALVCGVRDYFKKQKFTKACLGLSGGIDSALTACIAVDALGKENVLAISMPSRFSSLESMEDSSEMAKNLKIRLMDIPIEHLFGDYLSYLSPILAEKTESTTAEENLQARIRGTILMTISNKLGYIVLSTGNKSEVAMGYATLYGDMVGGLGVLIDVIKTQVYELAKWINRNKEIIPVRIIEKPPSAELRPNQKDQDDLPDYSIVDTVLLDYVENHLSVEDIVKKHKLSFDLVHSLVKKIHLAEYKRRQGPPGIQVTKKAFGKGRQFPIVHHWQI
jgi:NAD+ synthase (glutamine-hydrolysing)